MRLSRKGKIATATIQIEVQSNFNRFFFKVTAHPFPIAVLLVAIPQLKSRIKTAAIGLYPGLTRPTGLLVQIDHRALLISDPKGDLTASGQFEVPLGSLKLIPWVNTNHSLKAGLDVVEVIKFDQKVRLGQRQSGLSLL